MLFSILESYLNHSLPQTETTAFINHTSQLTVNGNQVTLNLWDIGGAREYKRLRTLSFPETDIFVIVFSTRNRRSFDNVASQWIPEIRKFASDSPIILVGNDFLCDSTITNEYITKTEMEEVCKQHDLHSMHICSALTFIGIRDLFDDIIYTVTGLIPAVPPVILENEISTEQKDKKACILM